MGTHFYAQRIPSKKKKEILIDAIQNNDFSEIEYIYNVSYNANIRDISENNCCGKIHLGKKSGGWKFLFSPNTYKTYNKKEKKYKLNYLYPLTKNGITNFLKREDIIIFDDDGKKYSVDKFWEVVKNAEYFDGKESLDLETYHLTYDDHKVYYQNNNDDNETIKLLKEDGYDVKYGSEFYSDGLRFNVNNNFD